jgi:hypothetical protein
MTLWDYDSVATPLFNVFCNFRKIHHPCVQTGSFQLFHENEVRVARAKAADDVGMGQRQQDVGLVLRGLLRPQHLAQHWAPGFVVPNKLDRPFAEIINDAENGQVWSEPCANLSFY